MAFALTVIYEHTVSDAVDDAATKYPYADDVFHAAMWRIAKEPECGDVLEGPSPERRLFYLPPISIAKSPGLLVRYSYGENDATIDWVKFYPYSDSEAVTPAAYVTKIK